MTDPWFYAHQATVNLELIFPKNHPKLITINDCGQRKIWILCKRSGKLLHEHNGTKLEDFSALLIHTEAMLSSQITAIRSEGRVCAADAVPEKPEKTAEGSVLQPLQKAVEMLQGVLEAKGKEIDALKGELASWKKQVEAKAKEVEAVKAEVEEVKAAWKKDVLEIGKDIGNLTARSEALRRENEALRRDLSGGGGGGGGGEWGRGRAAAGYGSDRGGRGGYGSERGGGRGYGSDRGAGWGYGPSSVRGEYGYGRGGYGPSQSERGFDAGTDAEWREGAREEWGGGGPVPQGGSLMLNPDGSVSSGTAWPDDGAPTPMGSDTASFHGGVHH